MRPHRLTAYHRGDLFFRCCTIIRLMPGCWLFTLAFTAKGFPTDEPIKSSRSIRGPRARPLECVIAADGSKSRLPWRRSGARELEFHWPRRGSVVRSDASAGFHPGYLGTHQLHRQLPVGEGRCSLFVALPRGWGVTLQGLRAGCASIGRSRSLPEPNLCWANHVA